MAPTDGLKGYFQTTVGLWHGPQDQINESVLLGTGWMDPQMVKDSNPIEVAEFAIANQLDQEPTFAWWVRDALRHKKRIISKAKSHHWKTTHKWGI